MFSIKKSVITNKETYSLVKVTYKGNLATSIMFANEHQEMHYDENGGTGWFNVVTKPKYDAVSNTTYALILVEVSHNETTLDLEDSNFFVFSNAIEALFDHPISQNTKVAAYELATCEYEYAVTIENSTMIAVEQLPLTVDLIETLRQLNSIEKPIVIPTDY